MPPDTVHIGLLEAFADGIVAGIKEDAALVESLPAGTISFICAAHAEVGSSFIVFKTIGRSVIRLLFFDNRSPSAEELVACLGLASHI